MIDKIERVAMLYDFYGKLLTQKQQEILSLYYEQDLSLAEIAEEYKVSRQAIHDILRRTEKILEGFEEKLELVKKFTSEKEKLTKVLHLLDKCNKDSSLIIQIKEVINQIVEIQDNE